MKLGYRPEIDGMRAIAVSAVILYHLKIPFGDGSLLAGGYLGVDRFFVLSGYLITKIILIEFDEADRFDVVQFYWRRARRILPPLLLVMLATIPVAWAILLPTEMERFAKSLFAALGFYSNFFWFFELNDYGAQSGLLQPFLHTWSLAIEEQFYLVFPVALLVLYRWLGRQRIGAIIVAFMVLSFVISQVSTAFVREFSFFSPASRAWEMLAGSLLAYMSLRNPGALRGSKAARVIPSLALLTLLASLWSLKLSAISHPGYMTIPVILATCAMIWFADPREPVTRLLSTRPFVMVGKLSYSLYLWHFPIFAFGRLRSMGEEPGLEMLVWLVLTILLSWLGYLLVEKPLRFRASPRLFVSSMTACLAAVLVFSATTLVQKGFAGRLGDLAAIYGDNDYDNEALKQASWSVLDDIAGDEVVTADNAHGPSRSEAEALWFRDADKTHVLVLGNSHSKDMFNALYLNGDLFPDHEFARFGLGDAFPENQVETLLASPNFEASDLVLIAPRYTEITMSRLGALIDAIGGAGKRVAVVGNTVEYRLENGLPVFDWYVRREQAAPDAKVVNQLGHTYELSRGEEINAAVRAVAEEKGVPYLSRRDLLCSDAEGSCALMTPDGRKALYDYSHWTLEGARHFGALAAERGWLDE